MALIEPAGKIAHTIVLDTGALIKNEPSITTLQEQFEEVVTVPAVIDEIRDASTRARFEMSIRPFLRLQTPSLKSTQFVTDFARRTGDLVSLSSTDISVIALAYDIECERNQGDWRLRRTPGQKGLNGRSPPASDPTVSGTQKHISNADPEATKSLEPDEDRQDTERTINTPSLQKSSFLSESAPGVQCQSSSRPCHGTRHGSREIESGLHSDDSEWITPSNLHKKQATVTSLANTQELKTTTMQVTILTTDFAMQNVILQINLNLLSSALLRVKRLKSFILRCHACFLLVKDMTKSFCPRCGQATLTKVTCSTDLNGAFQIHLKKQMQWNTRGDRYSVPKPVHGSANGKVIGGGKNGWGNLLILTEDQKEYQRAKREGQRTQNRNLLDIDVIPDILPKHQEKHSSSIRIGASRNINSKRR